MTRLNLLDALTSFTNEVMREILLPVRRQKGDEEEPAERPPLVYRQRLPDVKSATSKAPYILHQIVTGEDEQKPGEPTDSSVEVRSLFCVYGEDDQEGALRLLTTVEHFRQELLMHGVIAKQFALDLSQKLSTLYYTDNTAPYFCAELVSVWKSPVSTGRHLHGKSQRQGRCEKRRLLYVHRAEHRRHDPAGAYSVR